MTFQEFAALDKPAEAAKRIKEAAKAKYTPVPGTLDVVNSSGVIKGDHGTYQVTLESCPCGDFRKRHLPCKHMYRLAYELGAFVLDGVKSDETKIPATTVKERKVLLQSAVLSIRDFPTNELESLHELLYCYIYHKENYPARVYSANCARLVSAGLAVILRDPATPRSRKALVQLTPDTEQISRQLYQHVNSLLYPTPDGEPVLLAFPDGSLIEAIIKKDK